MNRQLDKYLVESGRAESRSQADKFIKSGFVSVNESVIIQTDYKLSDTDRVELNLSAQYVSRAAYKLESVARKLNIDFRAKTVLDVGSSTGGFTDYALQHGASRVIDVEIGSRQLHLKLRDNPRVELHENTDIKKFKPDYIPDIVLIDISFTSLRDILPAIVSMAGPNTEIVAMLKPQFETKDDYLKHNGVIKNSRIRRKILDEFEQWLKASYVIQGKADSDVYGVNGNRETFYKLRLAR